MPHLVIVHSTDGHGDIFDAQNLMEALHDAAAATGVMQAGDIKIRATPYSDYLVAGKRDGFCHITVSMLEGRTPEQKVAVSEALRAVSGYCLRPRASASMSGTWTRWPTRSG
jgi:5-carboxymethyl-2-hydroxymuconate isomerase